ncbi:MoaD/ThiS family protein [Pseudofrankia asymbiotica]|uniref:MoaD/ThiS family protein n=1 Tax=Pseudofrankia asymbiotica TaxID=1834516 RepID=UPI001F520560|nr:MoaD/ThiS family protein [Pseudofrankia asymbiotica]
MGYLSGVTEVTVRYWAAARDAAGVAEERLMAETLAAVIEAAVDRHGPRLAEVLTRCSFLIDEKPAGRRDPATLALRPGSVVEALPPFAGG